MMPFKEEYMQYLITNYPAWSINTIKQIVATTHSLYKKQLLHLPHEKFEEKIRNLPARKRTKYRKAYHIYQEFIKSRPFPTKKTIRLSLKEAIELVSRYNYLKGEEKEIAEAIRQGKFKVV